MSSPARQPLNGTIRQRCKVVGGICLPEKDVGLFIAQFNHCYGPLQLKIDIPVNGDVEMPAEALVPVGAGVYNPFRPK